MQDTKPYQQTEEPHLLMVRDGSGIGPTVGTVR